MGYTANLCAIDLTKAFDKVNHFALYIKLMKRYVPVQILGMIENLFSGCCTCVKWGNSGSTEFQIEFGVRQGSVLSPFLFAIDDLRALCKPGSNLYITRSHGSVTSVVRATREVNGRRQIYPSHHTHTP